MSPAEQLTEVVPTMQRVALLNFAALAHEPNAPLVARYEQYAKAAAGAKGLNLIATAARDPEGVRQAFAQIETARAQGIVVGSTGSAWQLRHEVIDHTRRLRLPSISALPAAWAEAGGLATYGPNVLESFRTRRHTSPAFSKGRSPPNCRSNSPQRSSS
jgi:hypothetical protein